MARERRSEQQFQHVIHQQYHFQDAKLLPASNHGKWRFFCYSLMGYKQKQIPLPGGPFLLGNRVGGEHLLLNSLHLWSFWRMIHIRQPSNSISEPRLSVENQVGRLARAVVHQKVPIFVDTSEATTRTTTTTATALRKLSKMKVQNFLDAPFNETCLGYVLSTNLSGNRITSTFSSYSSTAWWKSTISPRFDVNWMAET